MMYRLEGEVPDGDYVIPFGLADIKRVGKDVTAVATSSMVHVALEAADMLAEEGISVEVVDPRTLVPLDTETIAQSVIKTGRAVIIDEGHQKYGVTAEIASAIQAEVFDYLDAPIARLGAADVPVPFSPSLEVETIPNAAKVVSAIKAMWGPAGKRRA
jgi:pyruvate dehydrogenase E1 component beta subunit